LKGEGGRQAIAKAAIPGTPINNVALSSQGWQIRQKPKVLTDGNKPARLPRALSMESVSTIPVKRLPSKASTLLRGCLEARQSHDRWERAWTTKNRFKLQSSFRTEIKREPASERRVDLERGALAFAPNRKRTRNEHWLSLRLPSYLDEEGLLARIR
jgi:hypothetical protein